MRHRKKLIMLLICLCMVCIFSACEKVTRLENDYVYYINEEENALEKDRYDLQGKKGEDAVDDLLKHLSKESGDVKYIFPLSDGVKVQAYDLQDGNLTLDMNEAYASQKGTKSILIRAAVVLTLLQVADVDRVAITVDGVPLTDMEGQEVGFMDENSFVQNTGSTLNSYQTASLKLYFADENGDQLLEESKDVKYSSNISLEKLIVEQLIKGPTKSTHYPVINPATKLLGISIKDGICYVNFDENFLVSACDVKPEITIYSIVNSLIDGTNASQVQISVNGETNVTYMEKVDLNQVFNRDTGWIKEAD
ncbi:MAG: GerMN domain-containing protein [Hespellia sp.]|nr:GerMN domain-containing protein [Hespellia sp.]